MEALLTGQYRLNDGPDNIEAIFFWGETESVMLSVSNLFHIGSHINNLLICIMEGLYMADPKRKKAEELIYKVLDSLDKTHQNTEYYQKLFTFMDDKQFYKFCERDLPFRFHTKPFEIEPSMTQCFKALNVMKVPLMERVAEPFLYEDRQGRPVMTPPAYVVYIHIKKMKQFLTKKNAMSTGIDERDMKTGLLVQFDKNGKTSDREMEALAVMGLNDTTKEFSTWRADSMDAKSIAYQTIATTGKISDKDIPVTSDDSLARNMTNVYLLGSGLYSNILNVDYMLPITIRNKQRKVVREK